MILAPITVAINGHPPTLTAAKAVADPWKGKVAFAFREQWVGGYWEAPCALSLVFRIAPAWFKQTVVTNLLKATIDGLANVVFKPAGGGQPGPYAREDWWITQLKATKVLSEGTEGVSITLDPVASGNGLPAPASIDVTIPGSPPLLPGDARGAAKVAAWHLQFKEGIRVQLPQAPTSNLDVRFDFIVEPNRFSTSDLDNFCVPAAQSVGIALGNNPARSDRIHRVTATKTLASVDVPAGTRVRVGALLGTGPMIRNPQLHNPNC
jgi:hypothetical protein